MQPIEQIKARLETAVPGARLEVIANGSPSGQSLLLIDREHGLAVAKILRD